MKNRSAIFCIFLLSALSFLCESAYAQNVPSDFSLIYQWQQPTLYKQFRLENQIWIGASGAGRIAAVPGDQTIFDADAPRWSRPLNIPPDKLLDLYGFIEKKALLWNMTDISTVVVPTGGPVCEIQVDYSNIHRKLPCMFYEISEEFQPEQKRLIEMINALVPPDVWAEFKMQTTKFKYQDRIFHYDGFQLREEYLGTEKNVHASMRTMALNSKKHEFAAQIAVGTPKCAGFLTLVGTLDGQIATLRPYTKDNYQVSEEYADQCVVLVKFDETGTQASLEERNCSAQPDEVLCGFNGKLYYKH